MKRYAIIGSGGRGFTSYALPIQRDFKDCAELAALFDVNYKRMQYVQSQLETSVPLYTDFDRMLAETHPDCAIITTVDRFHDEYIARALDAGLDVITEKPMAINAEKVKNVLDAEVRNNHKIHVVFNVRFMPYIARLKQIMRSGVIGDVLNVDFEWMLDNSHGASYFRRWHRMLENSGGLMVHKATHHFDLVNFLIEQDPVSVYAEGKLCYYGGNRRPHGPRCKECDYARTCEFAFKDYNDPEYIGLYEIPRSEDGYSPDKCLFDGEINMYDNMNLVVRYNKGATMTYSLIAHSPYEGWKMSISGTRGRLEASSGVSIAEPKQTHFHARIFDRQDDLITVDVPEYAGGHGGGDMRLLDMLLRGGLADPLNQTAGSRDGTMSCMIGICANESIKTGRPVKLTDLLDVEKYFG